jgi:hypothetical protein
VVGVVRVPTRGDLTPADLATMETGRAGASVGATGAARFADIANRSLGLGYDRLKWQKDEFMKKLEDLERQRDLQRKSDMLGVVGTLAGLGLAGPLSGALGVSSTSLRALAPSLGDLIGGMSTGTAPSASATSWGVPMANLIQKKAMDDLLLDYFGVPSVNMETGETDRVLPPRLKGYLNAGR